MQRNLNIFVEKATQMLVHTGKQYKVDQENENTIKNIVAYFSGFKGVLDLNKGIVLFGPPGCGKTILMHVIGALIPKAYAFQKTVCQNIGLDYQEHGIAALKRFNRNTLFDDLGDEDLIYEHFGQPIRLMEYLIKNMYVSWVNRGVKMFFTTNSNEQMLNERYGSRAFDRLVESCNFVVLYGPNRRLEP